MEWRTGDNGGPVFFSLYLGLSASWCISQHNLFRLPHLSLASDMKMWMPASGPSHIVTSAIWRHHWGRPYSQVKGGRRGGGWGWRRESLNEKKGAAVHLFFMTFVCRVFYKDTLTFPVLSCVEQLLPQCTVSIEDLITLVNSLVYHTHCVWNLNLTSTQLFSYCLFSRTYGQQHGANQHCGVVVKLKTCLWLCSHAKSLIPGICLLASLNNVWRGILIRLGLIKE